VISHIGQTLEQFVINHYVRAATVVLNAYKYHSGLAVAAEIVSEGANVSQNLGG